MHLHSCKTFAINKEICINAENQNSKVSNFDIVSWLTIFMTHIVHCGALILKEKKLQNLYIDDLKSSLKLSRKYKFQIC